jgi:hypothetical protein
MTVQIMGMMEYDDKVYNRYSKKINLKAGQSSNAIALPHEQIKSITIYQTGNANIYLTNYSLPDIENNKAKWVLYDNVSAINPGITAIKATNTTGITVKIMITAMRGD